MVVGNGMIAKVFGSYIDNDDVLIFASGVSNSQNRDVLLFEREINLLEGYLKNGNNRLFVYFSSCSITDETLNNSLYVRHKINIEDLIKELSDNYLIIRVSHIAGVTKNPNTLLNFLYNKILNGEKFTIWRNAKRNLIDVEDLYCISKEIIDNRLFKNQTINIANSTYISVLQIVMCIESLLSKKANYQIEDLGGTPFIDVSAIQPLIKKLNIDFNDDYLERILLKYYF